MIRFVVSNVTPLTSRNHSLHRLSLRKKDHRIGKVLPQRRLYNTNNNRVTEKSYNEVVQDTGFSSVTDHINPSHEQGLYSAGGDSDGVGLLRESKQNKKGLNSFTYRLTTTRFYTDLVIIAPYLAFRSVAETIRLFLFVVDETRFRASVVKKTSELTPSYMDKQGDNSIYDDFVAKYTISMT